MMGRRRKQIIKEKGLSRKILLKLYEFLKTIFHKLRIINLSLRSCY